MYRFVLAMAGVLVGCSSAGSGIAPSGAGGDVPIGTGGRGGATAVGGDAGDAGAQGGNAGGATGTGGLGSGGGAAGATGGATVGTITGTGGTTGATGGAFGNRDATAGDAFDGPGGSSGGPDGGPDGRASGATDGRADSSATDVAGAADAKVDLQRADASPSDKVTVYIAGDSTVSTYTNSSIHQAGWGQFLQTYFDSNAKIVNKAVGGMTARHFIEAGYLDGIVSALNEGDYLLVQFGTNDGNKTATYTLPGSTTEIPYYLDPATDFKTYLTKYVDATRAKRATTIFVTPPPRHTCNAGQTGVSNGLASYATAMKELGPTLSTPVVDLNAMTVAYLANVTCETSGSTFYLVKADGTTDGTHFQENGANVMAGLVAKGSSGIATLDIALAGYVK